MARVNLKLQLVRQFGVDLGFEKTQKQIQNCPELSSSIQKSGQSKNKYSVHESLICLLEKKNYFWKLYLKMKHPKENSDGM